MEDLDIATITKRSIHGVMALVSRTFAIQLIGQVVTFLLTVYLSPADYGVFFIVSAVTVFFSYFSDIGLAAALIQKKEALTEEDLKTTFTIQQVLVVSLIIIGFLLTDTVASIYKLDQTGIYLYQALLVAFFFSSLKTIPSIILERNLNFKKLVIPEIVETLLFNVTVLVLAIQGFGISSFTYAVLLRGFSGLVTIYIIAPWKIGLGFSKTVARRLLSYGVPFQANSILALAKDQLIIIYLGAILPRAAMGYIGFAQKWAFMPLRLVMDNIIRITFPSFSRLSGEKEYLGKGIEKSIFAVVLFIFPVVTGMVILMPYLFNLIPKYQKWDPAYFSLVFFALNALLSSVSTPLTNALNAIGKIKVTLLFMVFWTVATWVLTPFAVMNYGYNAYAGVTALIATSLIVVIIVTKRYIPFTLNHVLFPPAIATAVMGVVVYSMSQKVVTSIPSFLLMVAIGAMIYFGVLFLLARNQIKQDIRSIALNLKK